MKRKKNNYEKKKNLATCSVVAVGILSIMAYNKKSALDLSSKSEISLLSENVLALSSGTEWDEPEIERWVYRYALPAACYEETTDGNTYQEKGEYYELVYAVQSPSTHRACELILSTLDNECTSDEDCPQYAVNDYFEPFFRKIEKK